MNVAQIREKFLAFFESKGHSRVRSSSLIPANDPTLLFVNSGMVQFKDVFLGTDKRSYTRATTAQRSVRAGGKHNDLENVGYTARHHTFFEMLGNFSFGDYFKRDAIHFAWTLLTEVYGLPKDKLWATVYAEDDEAYDIWKDEIGVPPERIVRIGDNKGARYASDNFWQMADTGPCGPCSEIFYDHGPEIWGGPPGSPDADGDRYIEIWNLVFMQFNMDEQGQLHPLPKPCVDTGMGLERLAAILQHGHSNYDIDLFQRLIAAAGRETGCSDLGENSLKVIADHIRACSFLVVDGIIPGSDGRGYVLRRIIRRALRHGYKLGQRRPFFHKLVPDLVTEMGEAYPELAADAARVSQVLLAEEERFGETLENGMKILESSLASLPKGATLPGETVFALYDTYGFPVDLTADIAREKDIAVDMEGFELSMGKQRTLARAAGRFKMAAGVEYTGESTAFTGYESMHADARVVALYVGGTPVQSVESGQDAIVVLDTTPFYAESGGQVGDCGLITAEGVSFEVQDTQKIQSSVFGHHGLLKTGTLTLGDAVSADVDAVRRARTMRNHSATHLMHKALREVLGSHVQQKGSLVDSDKTRFDFSHHAPMTTEQIAAVERIVNHEVLLNQSTGADVMAYDDAVKGGAMALFGEKYGDHVRVLSIGSSKELCGGTHVMRTGDIGLFKILSESGVAAGVRRVEATTGDNAVDYVLRQSAQLADAARQLRVQPDEVAAKTHQTLDQIRVLEKELARLRSKVASSQGNDLAAGAIEVKGIKVLAVRVEGADARGLRETMDKLKDKLKTAAIVLAAVDAGKVSLIAGVTSDATSRIKAGDLVNFVAQQVGGKGGGKADMAQAGGNDVAALPQALASVTAWAEQRL